MIHARGLVQTFTTKQGRKKVEVQAVDGVDLDVAEGEVVGFLGPNGAGKTTTLRMLTTLLRPTAGTATVAGYDVVTRVPAGTPQHRLRLPGRGRLLLRAGRRRGRRPRDALRPQPGAGHRSAARSSSSSSTCPGCGQRTPKQMSGGQKRRLDIVMGLVHDPTLIFLDEPTTGLDPQARANLWEHIADLRSERGATVFLTTHYLDEADALSDRIMIIDQGRIVASDTAENLKAAVSGDLVDLEVADAGPGRRRGHRAGRDRRARRGRRPARPRPGRRAPGAPCPDCCATSTAPASTLDSIEVHRPTLDDVFLTLTGRSLRDAEAGADSPTQPVLEGADQ